MTTRSHQNLIRKIFTDPQDPAGFGSVKKVYDRAKRLDARIGLSDVKKVLASTPAYTLHKSRMLKFPTRAHLSPGINHYFQMDLMVLNDTLARLNKYRYILFVIDIFTKKLFLRPLKTKAGQEVSKALQSIIKENNFVPPLKLSSDRGLEFLNAHVKSFINKYNILHFTSLNLYHSAVVERVIRTMKERFARYMTHHNTKIFVPKLQEFVKSYNLSPHSSLPDGMSPNSVNKKNEVRVWKHMYSKILRRAPGFSNRPKLKVGQHVKLSSYPNTFRKSTDITHTQENFVITHVLPTSPTTYLLADLKKAEDIQGAFYREELQPIEISSQ